MAAGRVEGRLAAMLVAAGAGVLLSIRLDEPGWFDNEGRFAEVARQMLLSGDYVTPHVNGYPLLTKPPLTQWLAATVFAVTGPSEWGRLVPVGAAMATIFLVCRLGARLYDAPTGIVAGLMLSTMIGFVLEARTLRPDCLVILAVTGAVFAWHVAETGRPERRLRWLVVMYATLGTGMLAKGFVPPLLAAPPIALATIQTHGLRGIARLRPGLGVAIMLAILAPWHLAASLQNPGFAWDYVVNQHLLFALAEKVPRDSDGDTLTFFWQAFVGRGAPWVLFAPLALAEGVRGLARRGPTPPTTLLWGWVVGILLLFSITPSRLEHYSLPAQPAVALLAARVWQRARTDGMSPALRVWTALLGLALVAGGVVGLLVGERFAAGAYWLPQAPGLMALIQPSSIVACAAGAAFVGAAIAKRANGIVGAWVVGGTPFLTILVLALVEAEAIFSWRPVARALAPVPAETEVVFEAPVEYQIVGALDFYLGRSVTMLEPAGGYTPPAYLAGRMDGMFISKEELDRRWLAGRPMAIVSDPQQRRDAAAGLVPQPYYVLARFGDRWVLTNFLVPSVR